MIFSANTAGQSIIDIQCKPVALCVDSSRRAHTVLKNLLGGGGARPVKRQDDVVVLCVLDIVDETLIQRCARHGMLIQPYGKLRGENIVSDAVWCANLF